MTVSAGGDQFLSLDDARLRWRIEGSGPALLLLHGWALDLNSWDLVAPLLAQHFTVLRFDRRGFGLSEGTPDIHRNVDDLEAVLQAADVPHAAVLGMSQGARLAVHFALRHPARVHALILDGAPAVEAETELPLAQYRAHLHAGGAPALQAAVLAHPLMQLRGPTDGAMRASEALRATVARYRGLDLLHPVHRATAPDLRGIKVPTLIINGGEDSVERRQAAQLLQQAITGARREELAGAGHLALLDEPRGYARVVTEFLRSAARR
jgi:pimeloyl-ACP methyl ester carboxylesterase